MGQEAYLFKVKFNDKTLITKVESFLLENEFTKVKPSFYEMKKKEGILELELRMEKDFSPGFYLRFAVINPDSVLIMCNDFFSTLKRKFKVEIYDMENKNSINEIGTDVGEKLSEKRKQFPKLKLIPIRAGKEAIDYIRSTISR
ncbi:hypothetical protein COV20_03700 [Candidatus Woesearchaeota archaeon CG10_big_fil_rev_8_21_14_0_10_45_16]|nr:MAG: hypothetical protein COV20_03700 [Candidatus Woesearchaeota archaeon CG10_big_fil_rev_8_21_14_0_10_45_16]